MSKIDQVRKKADEGKAGEGTKGLARRMKGPIGTVLIILVVLALAAIVYFGCWAFASPTQRNPQLIGNGDYIEYSVASNTSTNGWDNGTVRLVFDNFTANQCAIDFISNDSALDVGTSNYTYSDAGGLWTSDGLTAGALDGNGNYMGTSKIGTIYGQKTVDMYLVVNGDMKTVYFIGENSGLPFMIESTGPNGSQSFNLTSTSIYWVADL